jgi:mRNA interferase RelE/StbE
MTRYELLIEPEVHQARKRLPGYVRQRLKRMFDDLTEEPRPSESKMLDISGLDVPSGVELRRLRVDPWRVIYGINEEERWVWMLAIRRRPPYDYEDLDELTARFG